MRCAVCLWVLLASRVAGAAVGTLEGDFDGDGKPDRAELLANGSLVIVDAGGRVEVKAAPSAIKARILVARLAPPASPQLVLDITNASNQREGVVLDKKGGWHIVARFPLGGVGLDREYGIEVDASPAGVYRFQSRFDVKRCDDAPAYLFAEKLEGTTFKKVDRLPTGVPTTAAVLTARLDTAPAPAPLVFQAKAVSHQAGATDAGGLAIPRELDDGRNETQWREDLPSGGEGHFFTFKPRVDKQRAQLLRIVPGDPTSAVRMKASGRPRSMAIVTKQGAWRFELPNSTNEALGAAYIVELPAPVFDCVSVVIESVHGPGPTTIAELGVYAENERGAGGEALLARIVAQGDSVDAAKALAKRGAAGAQAIDAELAKTTDAAVRRRLIKALVKIVDPAATASLVRAAGEGWVRDQDLLDLINALAANGQIAALKELAAKGGVALAARVAAAHALKPVGAGFTALVELAGTGPRQLRHEVIDRLALGVTDQLAQAATAQASATAAGDLWRAATKSARTQRAARATLVTAMLTALPGATDYERRYRLIDGIATHGDAAALATLDAALKALPDDFSSAGLRQVAIRAIASSPRVEAAGIVIAFATDKNPGVRLAALGALATTEGDASNAWHSGGGPDAIDRVIINAMADTWPDVRRRAATALGARCKRPGPAKILFEAVSKDKDLDVRGDALLALVTCNATGVAELLPFIWDSGKHPLPLRERAIGLVVPLGEMPLAERLCKQLPKWRGQAIESREAIALARAAMATLGLMKPACAAKALMDSLDDVAFPELVADAALALGELGAQCPAAAKLKLFGLAKSEDASIAVAAKRAYGRCAGK